MARVEEGEERLPPMDKKPICRLALGTVLGNTSKSALPSLQNPCAQVKGQGITCM